jgi:hypothetical protein
VKSPRIQRLSSAGSRRQALLHSRSDVAGSGTLFGLGRFASRAITSGSAVDKWQWHQEQTKPQHSTVARGVVESVTVGCR